MDVAQRTPPTLCVWPMTHDRHRILAARIAASGPENPSPWVYAIPSTICPCCQSQAFGDSYVSAIDLHSRDGILARIAALASRSSWFPMHALTFGKSLYSFLHQPRHASTSAPPDIASGQGSCRDHPYWSPRSPICTTTSGLNRRLRSERKSRALGCEYGACVSPIARTFIAGTPEARRTRHVRGGRWFSARPRRSPR